MSESRITAITGMLTIVATLVAAIPGFRQLAQDRPYVSYDSLGISILNPSFPDVDRARTLLLANRIPDSLFRIRLRNTGEGSAKEVRIEARVPGRILDAAFEPSASSRPVWVDLPAAVDTGTSGEDARARVNNLVPDRILQLNIRYNAAKIEATPHAYVVFDGKPAQYMSDVGVASPYTAWSAFVPAFVTFGGGALLTILVAGVLVLWRNRELAEQVLRFVEAVLRALFFGFRL